MHIHCAADVIGNDGEPFPDPVSTLRLFDVQVTMLLRQTLEFRAGIFFDQPKAPAISRQIPI
jgi:hypothetical protein